MISLLLFILLRPLPLFLPLSSRSIAFSLPLFFFSAISWIFSSNGLLFHVGCLSARSSRLSIFISTVCICGGFFFIDIEDLFAHWISSWSFRDDSCVSLGFASCHCVSLIFDGLFWRISGVNLCVKETQKVVEIWY